ncbi:hypothetical protein B0T18DRAFT_419836 [Schizothecium vesticola]|uniref:Uncharacterized protein n=1 Tax=Schizothecium vesticola TaxID=314040 RepID=A0AA40EL21_9PEZI|nr:hypothetical protein B0T18DRAFT_419836 [Schizothecium vesticola]
MPDSLPSEQPQAPSTPPPTTCVPGQPACTPPNQPASTPSLSTGSQPGAIPLEQGKRAKEQPTGRARASPSPGLVKRSVAASLRRAARNREVLGSITIGIMVHGPRAPSLSSGLSRGWPAKH